MGYRLWASSRDDELSLKAAQVQSSTWLKVLSIAFRLFRSSR
jgi:hypothetical protein